MHIDNILKTHLAMCSIPGNLSVFWVFFYVRQIFDQIVSTNPDLESFIRIKENSYVLKLAARTHSLEITKQ